MADAEDGSPDEGSSKKRKVSDRSKPFDVYFCLTSWL